MSGRLSGRSRIPLQTPTGRSRKRCGFLDGWFRFACVTGSRDAVAGYSPRLGYTASFPQTPRDELLSAQLAMFTPLGPLCLRQLGYPPSFRLLCVTSPLGDEDEAHSIDPIPTSTANISRNGEKENKSTCHPNPNWEPSFPPSDAWRKGFHSIQKVAPPTRYGYDTVLYLPATSNHGLRAGDVKKKRNETTVERGRCFPTRSGLACVPPGLPTRCDRQRAEIDEGGLRRHLICSRTLRTCQGLPLASIFVQNRVSDQNLAHPKRLRLYFITPAVHSLRTLTRGMSASDVAWCGNSTIGKFLCSREDGKRSIYARERFRQGQPMIRSVLWKLGITIEEFLR